jgi:hypothetical protein
MSGCTGISLPDVAAIAGVGPSHFKVLFRKATGAGSSVRNPPSGARDTAALET